MGSYYQGAITNQCLRYNITGWIGATLHSGLDVTVVLSKIVLCSIALGE
jgi:hypothetical protein